MSAVTEPNPFIEMDGEYLDTRVAGGGDRWVFTFRNGYGASVVRNAMSYGGGAGLWETAVLDDEGLCFSTPITADVIGWQTVEDVRATLLAIAELPAVSG